MKLNTVELRSKPDNLPWVLSWLTSCSTSPCEKWVGTGPGSFCEGMNLLVGTPLKYCAMTLLSVGSVMAAARAQSMFWISLACQLSPAI